MTLNEEITLLLIGAGIALVSSLLSSSLTILSTYYLEKRTKREAKKEQALQLLGQIAGQQVATYAKGESSLSEDLAQAEAIVNDILKQNNSDDKLAIFIGASLGFLKSKE